MGVPIAIELCRMCEKVGVRTAKFVPAPGAHPACQRCDRRKCGKCGATILAPNAARCPNCRNPMGLT